MAPSLPDATDAEGPTALVTIAADPPPRLDRALARDLPREGPAAGLSRSQIARLIAAGAVSRAGATLADPAARVAAGERILLRLAAPAPVATPAQAIPLAVVWEDDELIVVDKPAGLVTHPAPGAADGTLVNALLHHCAGRLAGIGGEARPGIVHRLDKDTTGLLVAAKSDRAQAGLAAQFAARSVERRYLALVHGVPDAADPRLAGLAGIGFDPGGVVRIALPIGRHPSDRQRQAVVAGGRPAVTRVRVLARYGTPPAAALVECRLETGRTHQIRVHLAHAGHGLIGDATYGSGRRLSARALPAGAAAAALAFPRQALHAATLAFRHPVGGRPLAFAAPLPADMEGLRRALAGDDEC
ncbi:MAG: RluA family pseudouridine synthase [Rhodobacteraceae bacterium]|nr:RluA family pseudouridine synthase [Paracoccaceae bacterium]